MNNSKLLVSILSISAFILLFIFISYYRVPPLVDFQAHTAMGMISGPIFQFYQYQPSIIYRLFDSLIRFWCWLLGNHYARVAMASYGSVLILIFSTVYAFCLLYSPSKNRAFYITAILAGPIFLSLHCALFIWGVIPFTLSVFMAMASSVALWQWDQEIIESTQIIPFIKKGTRSTKICFLVYTLLAIFSHLAGLLYLAIAWTIPAARLLFIKKYRWQRIGLMTVLFISWLLLVLFTQPSNSDSLFSQLHLPTLNHSLKRFSWLLSGAPYLSDYLISKQHEGLLGNQLFRILLTWIPFMVTFLLAKFILLKKNNHWSILLLSQLILQLFLLIFILPDRLGELNILYSRHWLFIEGWTFLGAAYLLQQQPLFTLKKLSFLAPVLMALCCFILLPIYANFRQTPIEKTASHYAQLLVQATKTYQQEHPELKDKTIIIDYQEHNIAHKAWHAYNLLPFIMILSPQLINNHIMIREHWQFSQHIPIHWKAQSPLTTQYLRWKSDTKDNITLESESVILPIIPFFQ